MIATTVKNALNRRVKEVDIRNRPFFLRPLQRTPFVKTHSM